MSKREQLLVAPLPPDAQAAFKSSAAERAERFQNAVDTNVLRNELPLCQNSCRVGGVAQQPWLLTGKAAHVLKESQRGQKEA